MGTIIWRKPFLIILQILFVLLAAFSQLHGQTKTEKQHGIFNEKSEVEIISSQLDTALLLLPDSSQRSLSLTNSSLTEAKRLGISKLEMRSYYVLGRINKEFGNYDLSLAYLDTALNLAEEMEDHWYKGDILFYIGGNKYRKGESIQALEAYNAAIVACRLSNNYKVLGSTYSMIGNVYRINGLYDRAIEYIIKSKLNYEKADMIEGSAWAAYLLGMIYSDSKQPDNAREYFHEALKIYTKLALEDGNRSGLVICYEQIASLELEVGNFNEARKHINNSLKINESTKLNQGMSNVHKNMGKLEYYLGNYTLAEKHLRDALQLKKEYNDIRSVASVYEYLGLTLIKQNHIKKGFELVHQGLNIAIANDQKKMQMDIYSKLSDAYLNLNDLKKALAYQSKQIEIQNIILSGHANIKIEQLQAIYEIDEKNSQIAELERENEIKTLSIKHHRMQNIIMIFAIVLALLISLTIYWFYKKLQRTNKELNESNSTKDKFFTIIAHDLRGPTGALASFLEHLNQRLDDFSPEELKSILETLYKSATNVSNLLENLLVWASSQVGKLECKPQHINLSEILSSSYLGLKQSAENKQINIEFETDDKITVFADPNMLQIVFQNILGNAIKFTHRKGTVIIKSYRGTENNAKIIIIDDGVGIDKTSLTNIFDINHKHYTKGTEDENSTGLGLILVKDFIQQNKGDLKIESEINKGTTVTVILPLS